MDGAKDEPSDRLGPRQRMADSLDKIFKYKYNAAQEITSQLVLQEEFKTYPISDVWDEFCRRQKVVADESWLKAVQKYEKDVLLKR